VMPGMKPPSIWPSSQSASLTSQLISTEVSLGYRSSVEDMQDLRCVLPQRLNDKIVSCGCDRIACHCFALTFLELQCLRRSMGGRSRPSEDFDHTFEDILIFIRLHMPRMHTLISTNPALLLAGDPPRKVAGRCAGRCLDVRLGLRLEVCTPTATDPKR
jgi:hypothetical protein